MFPRDFGFLVGLSLLANLLVAIVHAGRTQITLAPTYGVAGALTLMLWQLMQWGWWVELPPLHFNAAPMVIVPALMMGAILTYAHDGLRTSRIYLLVLGASGLMAWAFATFRESLSHTVMLPYSIVFSGTTNFAMILGLIVGGFLSMLAYEFISRQRPLKHLAAFGAPMVGASTWLIVSSLSGYGIDMGIANIREEAIETLLLTIAPAILCTMLDLHVKRRGQAIPARAFKELLAFWRSSESNLLEAREEAHAAKVIISDLRRLNRSLEQAERARDHQMLLSPLGILYVDDEGRVLKSNTAAKEILQGGGELAGRLWRNLLDSIGVPPIDLSAAVSKTETLTIRIDTPGGQHRWYDVSVLGMFNHETDAIEYNVFLRDSTKRELQTRRSIVESRVNDIHRTGKVIAHDFSNLLLGVEASLHALGPHVARSQESQRNLQNALQALARVREMLKQLGAAQMVAAPTLVSLELSDLTTEAINICQGIASMHSIRIRYDSYGAEARIDGDANQLIRVITNLLKNAIRASPDGAEVLIAITQHDPGFTLAICDEGSGMTPEQLSQAFEPGFTTKDSGEGGLGLAISYLIVDAHGGTLRLAPNATQGITASMWLPKSTLIASPTESVAALVSLDDKVLGELVVDSLEQCGISAIQLHSVEELEAFMQDEADNYEIVVTEASDYEKRDYPNHQSVWTHVSGRFTRRTAGAVPQMALGIVKNALARTSSSSSVSS